MRIRLTALAVSDIETAAAHYTGIDPGLGVRFVAEVDTLVERIAMFPKGAPPVDGFTALRRARLRRFPDGVFSQQTTADELLLVRVLHARRNRPDALESGSGGRSRSRRSPRHRARRAKHDPLGIPVVGSGGQP